ncbi:hypothetical protein ACROYT_G028971 [Oculina patagonica]
MKDIQTKGKANIAKIGKSKRVITRFHIFYGSWKKCQRGLNGDCSNNPCQHGGNCSTDSNGNAYCTCPKDFAGYFCQFAIPTATPAPPQWTNWTECFGRCNAKIQMRRCLYHCGDYTLEIRNCPKSQNCTAHKIRILHFAYYWAKVKLEINIAKTWEPFCDPAWDINMAHEVCRIQGFPSAEAALEGNKNVDNDSCVLNPGHNKTCDTFEREISTSCNNTNEAVAVCKVPVSLDGSYAGIIQVTHNETLQTISVHGWNMKAADVVCRELGFKAAIAPFSNNGSVLAARNTCIQSIRCSGKETSLSYCFMNYTAPCKANTEPIASVTCDPTSGLVSKFREVVVTQLGKPLNYTCSLNSITPRWYDINGQVITEGPAQTPRRMSVWTILNNATLTIDSVTLDNAGVYFCNGTKQYGSLIIYVKGGGAGNCSDNPCDNGKVCNETSNGYDCVCPAGHVEHGNFCAEIPNVYITTENVTFGIGDPVSLTCKIENTKLFVTANWTKEKAKEILEVANFSYDTDERRTHHKLYYTIKHVSTADEGTYTCFVNYYYGIRQASYWLKVRDFTGHSDETGDKSTNSVVVTLSIISGLLCLSIAVCLFYHRRRVSALRNNAPHLGNADNLALERVESDTRYLSLTASRWEISRKQIDLHTILGSGAFGEVWKAVASGLRGYPEETTVAVKKLKHNSCDPEKDSLAQEIELGKSLDGDRHSNIVNFLACVSTSAPMMLILEYAPYGDLLGYLRKSRGLEDKYYSSPESCEQDVTSYDLLSFAQQISSGMRFLASKKVCV